MRSGNTGCPAGDKLENEMPRNRREVTIVTGVSPGIGAAVG
jgi:hypothetical protein